MIKVPPVAQNIAWETLVWVIIRAMGRPQLNGRWPTNNNPFTYATLPAPKANTRLPATRVLV